jgi:hypothetical protein
MCTPQCTLSAPACLARACAKRGSDGLALLGRVTDRFDVVAVEVDHVAAVVALVVMRPEPWRAVIRSSCGERSGVERVDRRPIGGREGKVQRCRRFALSDEEVNASGRSPPDASPSLNFLDAERCERPAVEAPAPLKIPNRKCEVIDEDLSL